MAQYGHLLVHGYHASIEFFRAHFGGIPTCGAAARLERAPSGASDGCPVRAESADEIVPPPCAPLCAPRFRGAYAVVERGGCSFLDKAEAAVAAGAAGLIVTTPADGPLARPGVNVSDLDQAARAKAIKIPIVVVRASRIALVLAAIGAPPSLAFGEFSDTLGASSVVEGGGGDHHHHTLIAVLRAGGVTPGLCDQPSICEGGSGGRGSDTECPSKHAAFAAARDADAMRAALPRATFDAWATSAFESSLGLLDVVVADAAAAAVDAVAETGEGEEKGVGVIFDPTSSTFTALCNGSASGGEAALSLFGAPHAPRAARRQLVKAISDGCTPLPLAEPKGAIFLIQRGGCTLHSKTRAAAAAGAGGVWLVNVLPDCSQEHHNSNSACDVSVLQPLDDGKVEDTGDEIPSALISTRAGIALHAALDAGVVLLGRIVPRADAASDTWDSLAALARSGTADFPADATLRAAMLNRLADTHAPNLAVGGHAGRWERALGLATTAGYHKELARMGRRKQTTSRDSDDDDDVSGLKTATKMATSILISKRKKGALSLDPAGDCLARAASQSSSAVAAAADAAGQAAAAEAAAAIGGVAARGAGGAARVRAAFERLACLEEAAAIAVEEAGLAVALLRERSRDDSEWMNVMRTVLNGLGVPKEDALDVVGQVMAAQAKLALETSSQNNIKAKWEKIIVE